MPLAANPEVDPGPDSSRWVLWMIGTCSRILPEEGGKCPDDEAYGSLEVMKEL